MNMNKLEVYTDDGYICLTQDDGLNVILLTADQIKLVVEWLEGAAKALKE